MCFREGCANSDSDKRLIVRQQCERSPVASASAKHTMTDKTVLALLQEAFAQRTLTAARRPRKWWHVHVAIWANLTAAAANGNVSQSGIYYVNDFRRFKITPRPASAWGARAALCDALLLPEDRDECALPGWLTEADAVSSRTSS